MEPIADQLQREGMALLLEFRSHPEPMQHCPGTGSSFASLVSSTRLYKSLGLFGLKQGGRREDLIEVCKIMHEAERVGIVVTCAIYCGFNPGA